MTHNRFIQELRGNLRLRLGFALIVAIIWLYAILTLQEALQTKSQAFRASSHQLARLQAVMNEGDWTARLAEAQALQADMESKLWRGDTLGLARATLQDWLNQKLQQLAATHVTVTMLAPNEVRNEEQAADASLELWKVGAKLVFDFNPDTLNKLLAELEQGPHILVVESLHITKEPIPRVELTVQAYFQPAAGQH